MIKAIVKENQIDKALQIADKNFKSHPGNCKAKRIEDFSFETPSSGSLKIIPPDNKIHLPVLPPTSMVGL
jgi:hypothetical protein